MNFIKKLFFNKEKYTSKFGGLWIDSQSFEKHLLKKERNGLLSEQDILDIKFFVENGYIIFRNAVDEHIIDQINLELNKIKEVHKDFIIRNNEEGYRFATEDESSKKKYRYIDFHVNSINARKAIFSDKITKFLSIIFETTPLAFQTLLFKYGSQQAVHQDTAYVVANEPMKLAASWIALEDVELGTGELVYYPGSHKHKEFLFSGEHKSWVKHRDGVDQHKDFLGHLHTEAKIHNRELEHFLPKKGDALIWHADLAHGGAKILKPTRTRYSLVTHYCPSNCFPNYSNFVGFYKAQPYENKGFYSSRHYDLRQGFPTKKPVYMGGSIKLLEWKLDADSYAALEKNTQTELKLQNGTVLNVCEKGQKSGFEVIVNISEPISRIKVNFDIDSNLEKDTMLQLSHKPSKEAEYKHKRNIKHIAITKGENAIEIDKTVNDGLYAIKFNFLAKKVDYTIDNFTIDILR